MGKASWRLYKVLSTTRQLCWAGLLKNPAAADSLEVRAMAPFKFSRKVR